MAERKLTEEMGLRTLDDCMHVIKTMEDKPEDEEVRRPEWGPTWVKTRGGVIQRVFTHDIWHVAEASDTLSAAGLPPISPWS